MHLSTFQPVAVFILYGSMHLYAFLKTRAAFAFGTVTSIFLASFMLIMILAPIIVRFSEKAGHEVFAQIMSYIGYTWLGILFLFISISLLIDFYRFVLYIGDVFLKWNSASVHISSLSAFLIPLVMSIIIAAYGYFEAKHIRTETVILESHKIPVEIGRLRIAQISDVHLGLIVREERLNGILQIVKKANPDILISTGDLVDGQIDNLSKLTELFHDIHPKYGKYAITGNHEFYAGIDQAIDFTRGAGFTVLRGQGITIPEVVNIVGVDDHQARAFGDYKVMSEHELLTGYQNNLFTLFLKHRPLVDKKVIGLFDLQLSGHVHKGQIFPFSLITALYYDTQAGFASLQKGSSLYVSRGSGTWGPPIRFFAPPEVTVIDIISQVRNG
jgi:predicted MPP superfamily phosphohydrolase